MWYNKICKICLLEKLNKINFGRGTYLSEKEKSSKTNLSKHDIVSFKKKLNKKYFLENKIQNFLKGIFYNGRNFSCMQIYKDDKYFPYATALEITFACNMRCLHCGSTADGKNRTDALTHKEWLKVIDDLSALGAHYVTLSGGEPFMYPEWRELIKHVNDGKKKISIITNASLIKEDDVVFMKENGVHNVAISLDGTQKTHDYIRQSPGSFEKVMRAIDLCQKHDLFVNTVTSINQLNFNEREEIIKTVLGKGLKSCQIQIVNSFGRAGKQEDFIISTRQYAELIDDIYAWQNKYEKQMKIFPADSIGYCHGNAEKILTDEEWLGCSAGCYILGIEANGNVKGCLSLQDDFFVAGNVRDKGLIDIWNDDNAFAYTRKYDPSKMTGKCGLCSKKEDCRAGCLGMAYSLGKTIHENPYCYKSIMEN